MVVVGAPKPRVHPADDFRSEGVKAPRVGVVACAIFRICISKDKSKGTTTHPPSIQPPPQKSHMRTRKKSNPPT
jgi:hypothetical protein